MKKLLVLFLVLVSSYVYAGSIAITGGQVVASGTNLAVGDDADFDTVGNWTGTSGATVTGGYDSGDSGHETCLRIEAGDATFNRARLYTSSLSGGDLAAGSYTISFDYKFISKTESGRVNLYTTTDNFYTDLTASVGSWTAYSDSQTIAATSDIIRLYVNYGAGTDTDELLIDNFSIVAD